MHRSSARIGRLLVVWGAVLLASCEKRAAEPEPAGGIYGPLPGTTRMLTEGRGALGYTAPGNGVIYVYDADTQLVVYSQQIEQGQNFAIDPYHQRILVNGREVNSTFGKKLARDHVHRLYFDPDPLVSSKKSRKAQN